MKSIPYKFTLLLLAAVLAFPMTGCKKEGCTESLALNYDSKAKKDDGECRFSEVVFGVDPPETSGTVWMTTFTLDGATVGTVQNSGTVRTTLKDGNAHTWSFISTWDDMQGSTSTSEASGTVAADPNRAVITIDVVW